MTRWEWVHIVLGPEGPSPTARLVLVALMTLYYGEKEGYAWPSVATLASRTGHGSDRTVQAALGEAEEAGWLRRVAGPRTTHYHPALKGVVVRFESRHETPARIAGVEAGPPQRPPQILSGPPQKTAATPAESAPDLKEEKMMKEGRKAGPACPLCSSPLDRKPPSKKAKAFWGCSTFRGKGKGGCPFTCETDDPRLGEWAVLPPPMGQAEMEKAARSARTIPALRVMETGDLERALAKKRARESEPKRVDVGTLLSALRLGAS